jgi:hypothetical protein
MKGLEGKIKMDDFLGLEFLSTLKVFMRNHMNRAYLEFIDTLPFFMLQKVLVLSKSFHSKTYLEGRKYSIIHHLTGSNYKVLTYIYVLSTRAITCHTCRESGSGPGLLYYN